MRTRKAYFVLSLVSLLLFAFTASDTIPAGWFKSGSVPDSYKIGIDKGIFKGGARSVFIESTEKNIDGFATLMQVCNAKKYLGTRVKMTGYIKSENVNNWAGMWFRVDSRVTMQSVSFDNMQERPITGTSDWTKCEITLEVPEESGTMNYGALITGSGKIWFDKISFEILDNKIPVITKDSITVPVPQQPVNLDFEE